MTQRSSEGRVGSRWSGRSHYDPLIGRRMIQQIGTERTMIATPPSILRRG